jgi:hypothetical protein
MSTIIQLIVPAKNLNHLNPHLEDFAHIWHEIKPQRLHCFRVGLIDYAVQQWTRTRLAEVSLSCDTRTPTIT